MEDVEMGCSRGLRRRDRSCRCEIGLAEAARTGAGACGKNHVGGAAFRKPECRSRWISPRNLRLITSPIQRPTKTIFLADITGTEEQRLDGKKLKNTSVEQLKKIPSMRRRTQDWPNAFVRPRKRNKMLSKP